VSPLPLEEQYAAAMVSFSRALTESAVAHMTGNEAKRDEERDVATAAGVRAEQLAAELGQARLAMPGRDQVAGARAEIVRTLEEAIALGRRPSLTEVAAFRARFDQALEELDRWQANVAAKVAA
jgi:hypothetical protein